MYKRQILNDAHPVLWILLGTETPVWVTHRLFWAILFGNPTIFLVCLSLLSSPQRGTSRVAWSGFVPDFILIQMRTLLTSQPCVTLSPCVVGSHPARDHAYLVDLYLTELSRILSEWFTPRFVNCAPLWVTHRLPCAGFTSPPCGEIFYSLRPWVIIPLCVSVRVFFCYNPAWDQSYLVDLYRTELFIILSEQFTPCFVNCTPLWVTHRLAFAEFYFSCPLWKILLTETLGNNPTSRLEARHTSWIRISRNFPKLYCLNNSHHV